MIELKISQHVQAITQKDDDPVDWWIYVPLALHALKYQKHFGNKLCSWMVSK